MPETSDRPDSNKQYPDSVTAKIPREKLPVDLQKLVDREDDLWDQLYDGELPASTESSVRYAAYANRLRTIMLSAQRYVAYTSDIGESFRPIAHPYLVKGAYAVSWAYLIGDVSHEGYKAYTRNMKLLEPKNQEHIKAVFEKSSAGPAAELMANNQVRIPAIEDWKTVVAQRAVFQSIASMGLPAFTIHSIVRYSGRALKNSGNVALRTWGPIGLGLAAVPALPYMFDEPVENAVEWAFYNGFKAIGGEKAVEPRLSTHRAGSLSTELRQLKEEEKKRQ